MAAMRTVGRRVLRSFSTGGKVLSEEEKAAENVYIKKLEREKLEKLARKSAKAGEHPQGDAGAAAADAGSAGAQAGPSSAEKSTNYVAIGGGAAALVAIGWYVGSRGKKSEDLKN
ncbi:uncharacterized protein At2g27730, mitochondrial-like [Wolffia australiana]